MNNTFNLSLRSISHYVRDMSLDNSTIRVVSFDIGRKNLAFYTEDVPIEDLEILRFEFKKLPKGPKRINGEINKHYASFLDKLFISGTRVPNGMGVFDIREDKESDDLDIETRVNLCKLLRSYEWLWLSCSMVVIEKQFFNPKAKKFGGGANIKAIKIGEAILMWFLDHHYYHLSDRIEMFGSQFKTQLLGAPEFIEKKNRKTGKIERVKMSKYDRKKWSVEKGKEIMEMREDEECITLLNTAKKVEKQKLDDMMDCVNQLQAYKLKKFIM